ncbi:cytochrome c oxidase accessory protein CcoG [Reinekea marinisedimentorum]|uniref:Cytochrome c oxidase accessory protein FixG n=1 Tax=Reinekea marinisedimentorum TaxID=230495 RepID=A0A4R3I947_9GAMM|nr:cytochrome c oxidase accessory protein CcoG [Reinekea marinisedimentorum]TCS40768.1 cytochrome c oxidase accessory protein FixG [Reinekea marinisedimentorum]
MSKNKTTDSSVIVSDLYQSKEKIYVRRIKGFYRNLRFFGGLFLFAAYFGTLWLNWDGQQAVLFDLPKRQFHVFGVTFWPQDFILLSWALIISAFLLFFITVFAGRVWCGYTCPQSVWTWIFLFIEEKTEGKRNARIKLDKQKLTGSKLSRKVIKHILWLLVAFATAFTFVGYFVPARELIPGLFQFSVGGWALFWIGFFTLATYGNAGWLREQVCIYMCPYARFQSVMFDQDTLIVSYDEKRGETRGTRKRGADPKELGLGDCIDCDLCVQVCPTGIDIRDGLQYECIGCAACVDACNSVMDKMGYDRGLVRYTTENSLEGKKTKIMRPRLIGYAVAMVVMIVAFTLVLLSRVPIELDIIRDRGALHQMTPNGLIQNSYLIKVANMTDEDQLFNISVSGLEGLQFNSPQQIRVPASSSASLPTLLLLPPELNKLPTNKIEFTIQSEQNERLASTEESRFFGPANF